MILQDDMRQAFDQLSYQSLFFDNDHLAVIYHLHFVCVQKR